MRWHSSRIHCFSPPASAAAAVGGRAGVVVFGLTLVAMGLVAQAAANWPQFRGPGGLGVATQGTAPVEFTPNTNVLWRLLLPPGNSSPCVWGDRLFLTGCEEGKLETYCVDRLAGKLLWRREVPVEKIEPVYPRLGNPASSTPATDGQRVYVYFGSFGLVAYDFDGKELWTKPLPTPVTEFGTGTSPILARDLLIINCDQDLNSYLLAVDSRTGQTAWRTERPGFPRGFGTPLFWRHGTTEEIVVPGTLRLKAYDLRDGSERWAVHGLARVVCTSPTAGDGLLFVACWSPGGDAGNRISMPAFDAFAAEHDRNKDGLLTRDEFPTGPFLERFSQIDANKDKVVTAPEWKAMEDIFARVENSLLAIRPDGQGEITTTHLAWKQTRGLPYVPSPLFYQGRLYLVKNGGLASCFDAQTGRPLYLEERLGALGDYYASPVAADGKIYAASQNGVVVVFAAGDTLKVLARNDLAEPIMATPAIADGQLFIRTATTLYAFGK